MRALLDVNVLVALLDADHVHHLAAREWLAREGHAGWASCPITQNGCLRRTAGHVRSIDCRRGRNGRYGEQH